MLGDKERCRSDFTDRRFVVLFSCTPGMREPHQTYVILQKGNTTVQVDKDGYLSSISRQNLPVKPFTN